MLEVVAGVDDDGQIFGRKDLGEAVGEFRAADSACQGDNPPDGGRWTVDGVFRFRWCHKKIDLLGYFFLTAQALCEMR